MSSRYCPAGGDHTPQTYNTKLWGIFVACSKCGTRDERACPVTGGNHNPQTQHAINPDTGKPEVVDICKACNKRL